LRSLSAYARAARALLRAYTRCTRAQAGDELTMHYTGTLASDGSKFDSSVDKGRPFKFKIGLGMVIRGWDEGVMQMSLGEKAALKITSDYGYGSAGAGDVIPPDADLVFEVELLAVGASGGGASGGDSICASVCAVQ
jgi:FK506-binding protein 1